MAWGALFVLPNISLFTIFVVIPIIGAFALSLFKWDLIREPTWVGLANYQRILHDPAAVNSLVRTGYLVGGGVIPTVLLSFIIAVGLNVQFRGIRLVRTLYLMPIVISFVASAVLWRWIFDPRWGPINSFLGLVGVDGPRWLSSTGWALPAVTLVLIWLRLPLAIILYLAALQNINPDVIDAALLDGAGPLARMRHIIWPAVRPVTFLVTIVTLRGVLFEAFDVVNVMTGGGPLDSTNILIQYIYVTAFRDLQLGYASALSTLLFLVVLVIALVVMAGSREEKS